MKKIIYKLLISLLGRRKFYIILGAIVNKYYPYKLSKFYNDKKCHLEYKEKTVVYMADGKLRHGGLSDRLKGIVSTYYACLEKGYSFKIYFVHPFNIENFLEPNIYDWRISANELFYNKIEASPIVKITTAISNKDHLREKAKLTKLLKKNKLQLHVYTSTGFGDPFFSSLYNQLFKPTKQLKELISENLNAINGSYISISYRFQQLLNDFTDSDGKILDINEAENLIKRCINNITNIRKNAPKHDKVLITSDSMTFINRVSSLKDIYIIPGKIGHIDYTNSDDVNMKTFLDFYLISKALKAYLVVGSGMYESGFSKRASMINDIPYETVFI